MNQNNFSLRLAVPDDIDFIMSVEKTSFIEPIQESKEVFLKRIGVCPQLFFILLKDDVPAGYLSAELMDHVPVSAGELKLGHEPKQISNFDFSKYVYISSFAVLPESRGHGAGKAFWNLALNTFSKNGFTKFLLLVNDEWRGAAHIYEQSGFSTVQVFPGFFPSELSASGESDGILMIKA